LQIRVHIIEIIRVPRHPNHQILVVRRTGLRGQEGGGVDDVELHMVAAQGEVAPDQVTELHHVLLLFEQAGEETLVQQCAARPGVVELGERLHHRRRTVGIRPVRGGGAVGDRLPCQPAVGGGPHHLAEIDVAGGREHVEVVLSARLDVGFPVDGSHQVVVDLHRDGVGIVVVVAEEGGAVHDGLAQQLLPLEIVQHCI